MEEEQGAGEGGDSAQLLAYVLFEDGKYMCVSMDQVHDTVLG